MRPDLFELIGASSARRATGVLEILVREQKRSLPMVSGELYLPAGHPHASRWRELLPALHQPEVAKRAVVLIESFVAAVADWLASSAQFRDGLGLLPTDLVGPLPTCKFLRLAAGREPRTAKRVSLSVAASELIANPPDSEPVLGWTQEELWIFERLRQPMGVPQLERGAPVSSDTLRRALAGLLKFGYVRPLGAAATADDLHEIRELVGRLAERIAASLAERPLDLNPSDYRSRVAALLANAGSLDHYELLGLDSESDPDPEELQNAFEAVARLVHPGHADRYGMHDQGPALGFLFERLTIAYRTLSDPVHRLAYRARHDFAARRQEVDPETREAEVAKLARAQFERAQAEERNGDLHTALVLLEQAVRTHPRAEYWIALARLQAKNPAWSARTHESLRAALKLDPHNSGIRFLLGQLYERDGDIDKARVSYTAAARAAPPHQAAAEALARLAAETDSGGGARRLVSFFRRS